MKDKNIVHARQKAEIYKDYYRPSLNLWRFTKSILGVLISGNGTAANSYYPKKRGL
jgi:hypothetical protein